MQNITFRKNSSKLVIEIDISQHAQAAAQLSSTGKTRLLATTGGAAEFDCGVPGLRVAVNVMIPPQ